MTWQTMTYFSSIVVTFLLTGFLAWYAWRQGNRPVTRPYAWLALSECLMALTDIISMLSPDEAVRRAWFNARYLFAAIIPVTFFLFALEYNARKGWHSKSLVAGLFALPFLTQVMLWTNNLHGLWVTQEVGFQQNGPFWLVETGLRVPAPWFLLHNFYSQLLMLAGIVILLLAAWGKRKAYLGQSLLLSAGALVGILAAIIPAFNLLPQIKFNPFIPGIGLSALLYALAILRFDFLKRSPSMEGAARATALDSQEKRLLALFLLAFLLMVAGIASAGYLSYRKFEQDYRAQVEAQLTAIANLKVSQLENWRGERLADGEVFRHNPAFSSLVERIDDDPVDVESRAQLQAWLDVIGNVYQYRQIYLLDPGGAVLVASPDGAFEVSDHVIEELPAVLQSGQVTFLDFHRHPDGTISLGLLVPVFGEEDATLALGVLVMEIDPTIQIYLFLNEWPVPSETAETLLVRREGEEVVFLNPLRFQPDAALNLRFPLTETNILGVKAGLGETGMVEGVDYRGVEVLGVVGPVPGMPWFVVVRMDTAEVYDPLRARLWQTMGFFGVLALATGGGLGLAWRRQQMRYLRERAEISESLAESQSLLKDFTENSTSLIYALDLEGKFLLVNSKSEAILGVPGETLIGKPREAVMPAGIADAHRANDLQVIGSRQPATFEEENDEADGKHTYLSIKFPIATPGGQIYGVGGISTDISERKQAEEIIRSYSDKLEGMVKERTHELEEAQKRLVRQERLAALGQIAGSIGHELRNPLGVISNAIYYLKMSQPEMNETMREYLGIIEAETRTSDKIITDLLDFTRSKAVAREAVSVSGLIETVIERYPAPASVAVALEIPAELPKVFADPAQVKQVLSNLVINAYQAMPEGGQLTVSSEQLAMSGEQWVRIHVKDTGTGITPENMKKLFEPLFTTKTKGIGLGLAVCQKLIEANEGQIEVQSKLGKGSTFTVHLPVYKEQP